MHLLSINILVQVNPDTSFLTSEETLAVHQLFFKWYRQKSSSIVKYFKQYRRRIQFSPYVEAVDRLTQLLIVYQPEKAKAAGHLTVYVRRTKVLSKCLMNGTCQLSGMHVHCLKSKNLAVVLLSMKSGYHQVGLEEDCKANIQHLQSWQCWTILSSLSWWRYNGVEIF